MGQPTAYPPNANYQEIGLTPLTSSSTCVSETLPDWTAERDATWLTINPENTSSVNDGAYVSWGTIDDICIDAVARSAPAPKLPTAGNGALLPISLAIVGAGALLLWRRGDRARRDLEP